MDRFLNVQVFLNNEALRPAAKSFMLVSAQTFTDLIREVFEQYELNQSDIQFHIFVCECGALPEAKHWRDVANFELKQVNPFQYFSEYLVYGETIATRFLLRGYSEHPNPLPSYEDAQMYPKQPSRLHYPLPPIPQQQQQQQQHHHHHHHQSSHGQLPPSPLQQQQWQQPQQLHPHQQVQIPPPHTPYLPFQAGSDVSGLPFSPSSFPSPPSELERSVRQILRELYPTFISAVPLLRLLKERQIFSPDSDASKLNNLLHDLARQSLVQQQVIGGVSSWRTSEHTQPVAFPPFPQPVSSPSQPLPPPKSGLESSIRSVLAPHQDFLTAKMILGLLKSAGFVDKAVTQTPVNQTLYDMLKRGVVHTTKLGGIPQWRLA